MNLTIYTYGYAKTIFNSLTAIAMLRNSSFYPAIINVAALATVIYYAWHMAASRSPWQQYVYKVMGMIVLINALLLPKTSMNVKDNVTKELYRADNIPVAFALPIGILENIGHLVTIGFEQAFTTVDGRTSFNYYNYGTAFGARLARDVLNIKINDPEYVSNMNHFIKRCVILPAMIGKQFTKEDLVATDNIWQLVKGEAGSLTRMQMVKDGKKSLPTCAEATSYFEKKMLDQQVGLPAILSGLSAKYKGAGKDIAVGSTATNATLSNNIKNQINALYAPGIGVDNMLKNNLLISALNDYRSGSFPVTRAKMQYEAGGLISGDLADHILTGMLIVIKNILYGCFIFVVPLMLIGGGFAKYRMWITLCLSVQFWPALYAMLNMLIDSAYEPAHIVSYSSWATQKMRMDSMASVAANLMLLIPFLALWVTRMSESGLIHLAGSVLSTASSATAASAAEKSTGNVSWDNVSAGNESRNNLSSNKYDNSMQYLSGVNNSIRPDGSMERINPTGEVISTSGAGYTTSSGESAYRSSDGIASAANEAIRQEQQQSDMASSSFSIAKETQMMQEAQVLKSISEQYKSDNGYNIDSSTDSGQELVRGLNAIDRMSASNDYSWNQNAMGYLAAEGSLGKKIGGIFGGSISIGGRMEASNSSHQSEGRVGELVLDDTTHDRSSNNIRASQNSAFLESIGVDRNSQESLRSSYSETSRLSEELAVHQQNIDSYNAALEYNKTQSLEYSKDEFQSVVNAYREKYGVSDALAHREVAAGTIEAREIFTDISKANFGEIIGRINSSKEHAASRDIENNFSKTHESKLNKTPSAEIDQYALNYGMKSKDAIEVNIEEKKQNIQDRYESQKAEADLQYQETVSANKAKAKEKEAELDKYEEDRIGSGKVSRAFGGLGKPKK